MSKNVQKVWMPPELTIEMREFILAYMIKHVGKNAKSSAWDFMCAYKRLINEFGQDK